MPDTPPDLGPISPDEEKRLEAEVDEMLDPRAPDAASVPEPKKPSKGITIQHEGEDLPPLDIFSDPKTAPDVPDEVLKTVRLDEVPKVKSTKKHEPEDPTGEPPVVEPDEPVRDKQLPHAELATDEEPAINEKTPFDDAKIDEAVDEITAEESDEVLAAEDEKIQKAFEPKHSSHWLKHFFAAWWGSRLGRWGTISILLIIITALAVVPMTRSYALNLVGVRGAASVTVLDNTTDLPLKNATVELGSQSAKTDDKGNAKLYHAKLGKQTLTVKKIAFATVTTTVNVSWGSNNLGQVALKAVGTQYHFNIVDYVSGQPVTTAEAVSGEANAEADSKGAIVLTADNPDTANLDVTISASGYRSEQVSVPVGTTAVTTVQLVSSRKEVYISNQSGKYDVYKSDIDGKNKELLLAGTGNENSQITLVPNESGDEVALVSTRDNTRDSDGYLEQALTLINVSDGSDLTIDHSDKIEIIDWIGDRLVYAEVKPGASAANPQRYQLLSYDDQTKQRFSLAHANYFNDVVSADGVIYYATSNNYSGGVSQFAKINPDGSGAQVLLTDEVWNIYRIDYSDFVLQSAASWYTYQLGASKPTATSNAPGSTTTRLYQDSADGKHSLWVDTRDGKGALIAYDTTAKKDVTVTEQSGLTLPVHWLDNNTLIYRVHTSSETDDYVVSLLGGQPKKITDVTNVAGISTWYYY